MMSDERSKLQAVGHIAVAAVIAQAWDLVISFSVEAEYLWRGKFNLVKGVYFTARYVLLFTQIIIQALYYRLEMHLSDARTLCPKILILRAVVAQLALTLVEAVLFIRVYALYNKSFKIKLFLLFVFLQGFCLEITTMVYMVRPIMDSNSLFVGCAFSNWNESAIIFVAVGSGTTQIVILSMTLVKFILGRRAGWARTPLASLMLKEGVLSFAGVLGTMGLTVGYEFVRDMKVGSDRASQAWYTALLSILASRLVLNVRELAVTRRNSVRIHRPQNQEDFYTNPNSISSISSNSYIIRNDDSSYDSDSIYLTTIYDDND